jgi:hypothetical protein
MLTCMRGVLVLEKGPIEACEDDNSCGLQQVKARNT